MNLTHLREEDLVFQDIEVHAEEARLQSCTESVSLHESNLRIGRLMLEQVFLWRNHVLKHLGREMNENYLENGRCTNTIGINE